MANIRYCVVTLRIVGGGPWETVYDSDQGRHFSFSAARTDGIERLGHDDFWVCELTAGMLPALLRILHSDGSPRDDATAEELKGAQAACR